MKKVDLAVVLIIPLLVFLGVFLLDWYITYFESLILIFVLPALYLSIRSRQHVKKVFLFSLFVSIPMDLIWELLGYGDNAWVIPNSIIPYRLFGFMPFENYMWMFLVSYIILMFYEHFCNDHSTKQISKKMRILNWIHYSCATLLVILFLIDESLIRIPYAYLWAGIIFFIIPGLLFLSKYPKYIKNFAIVSAFFFYIHLLFELVGVKLGHWIFSGTNYIGWISFGSIRFPIEEFFFVILLGGFAACTYYEFFTDKKL